MIKDLEKEIISVKDSVNSGLIDDDLSRLVKNVRNITSTPKRLKELSDEQLSLVAGGKAGLDWYSKKTKDE